MTATGYVLSILLLLVCFTGVLGQTSIKQIEVELKDVAVKFDGCEIGREHADRLISSRTISFPMNIESTLTLRKLLEIECSVMDDIYDSGTCLQYEDEAECFYKAMQAEIEKRWGKDFLTSQQRIANRLDKEGKGYIEPQGNGLQALLSAYLSQNAPGRDPQRAYSIVLKISPDKRILDFEVFHGGLFVAQPIERNSRDYTFIKGALNSIQIDCEPARLRGKPVESLINLRACF